MKMPFAALIAVASLFTAAHVLSQNPPFDRLSDALNLTQEQRPQVQAILQELQEKIQQAKTNADDKLRWVLYPAQYDKIQSLFQQGDARWDIVP